MNISVKEKDSYILVQPTGEINIYSAVGLKKTVEDLMNNGNRSVVLDFVNVNKIDSAGIGALVQLNNISIRKEIKFYIINPNDIVKRIFLNTALNYHLSIYDTIEDIEEFR